MQFDLVTFLFELVNFVVLAFLLQRWVYRPIARGIRERRDALAAVQQEAADKLAEAEERSAALQEKSRELDQLRERVFAEATADAATQRARLLSQAREDAAAERARVQSMLDMEREAALGWVRELTIEHGAEVASRLLLELVPDAAHEALCQRVVDRLPERTRELQAEVIDGRVEVEAAFARPPAPELVDALREALAAASEAAVRLAVAEEPELAAGLRLRVGDRILDGSLAGQLDLLQDEARRLSGVSTTGSHGPTASTHGPSGGAG